MNNLSISGHVDSDPRLLGMPGRDLCEFWIAVDHSRREFRLFLRVLAHRDLALKAAERLSNGDWIAVAGHLRSQLWKDGTKRRHYEHTLIARHIDFGERHGRGDQG